MRNIFKDLFIRGKAAERAIIPSLRGPGSLCETEQPSSLGSSIHQQLEAACDPHLSRRPFALDPSSPLPFGQHSASPGSFSGQVAPDSPYHGFLSATEFYAQLGNASRFLPPSGPPLTATELKLRYGHAHNITKEFARHQVATYRQLYNDQLDAMSYMCFSSIERRFYYQENERRKSMAASRKRAAIREYAKCVEILQTTSSGWLVTRTKSRF